MKDSELLIQDTNTEDKDSLLLGREASPVEEREDFKGKISRVVDHKHNGEDLPRTDIKELGGFIEVITAVPTHAPRFFYEQIKMRVNGATIELYVYDYNAKVWRKFT